MQLKFRTSAGVIDLEKIDFSKYERLSDILELKQYAKSCTWKTRAVLGYKKHDDLFDFLEDRYAEWIDKAKEQGVIFTQADLKHLDKSAWDRLQQDLRRYKLSNPEIIDGHMPNGLYLPNAKTARVNLLSDPKDKARLLRARELMKELKALQRAVT